VNYYIISLKEPVYAAIQNKPL